MYDAFGSGARERVLKRKVRSTEAGRFSPSFGVHRGLIPDPNWPPVVFPEDSVAMQRRFRRVKCELTVEFGGQSRRASGDLSEGGAMIVLDEPLEEPTVIVELGGQRAEARILAKSAAGASCAHHAEFIDGEAGLAVWRALLRR